MTYRVNVKNNKQLYCRADSALEIKQNIKYDNNADAVKSLQEKYGFDIRYKANGYIKYLDFKDIDHYICFEKDSWREQYGVELIFDDNEIKYLDFRDEKHYIWFMLRWS